MTLESNFYRNIFENLPEGVVICDADQNVTDINKNFERLTGYERDEVIGKNISNFLRSSKTSCEKCSEKAGLLEDNQPKSYYLGELIDKEDNLTCVRINFSITKDGKTLYLVIPLADVAFLNHAHIDFVSTVSHELRTPLTSIKGFAETLITSGEKLNDEQKKRFLNIIKSQVDRLTRLVENLLTVSKLESKKDKSIYKAIDLARFFESTLYNLQLKSREHTVKAKILPNLPPVWADSDKLEQVITNLVDNAIKYSEPGTNVIIEAKFAEKNTDFIQIDVIDEGIGIPEEYVSKIFTKFARIDNPLTRKAEGTGLGLYITKSLVENMGGKISLQSSDTGSTFSVVFPVATLEKSVQKSFRG